MASLIIIRHGESVWNLENRFTGETDIDLSPHGIEEAHRAGKLIKDYSFDKAYTSVLIRAIHTLDIVLEETGHKDVPVYRSAALNERNYGSLQGLNKKETEDKYGAEQVMLWRRSFTVRPPDGESLEDTYNRTIPYYKNFIAPELIVGKNILIVAHGNSLRALMMFLEGITEEEISKVNLPTGAPRYYQFDAEMKLNKVYYIE
jgi:2,3-bisphosphoglycerate-dependent phosphoglycerate mutase